MLLQFQRFCVPVELMRSLLLLIFAEEGRMKIKNFKKKKLAVNTAAIR